MTEKPTTLASDPKLLPIPTSEDEWRQRLDRAEYDVLRRAGTERPFIGKYVDTDEQGVYRCAACGNQLFESDAKFHSSCGWPSFSAALPDSVELLADHAHGMHRIEARCGRCHSHLGHLFDDGPADRGGERWCINSVSIDLDQED